MSQLENLNNIISESNVIGNPFDTTMPKKDDKTAKRIGYTVTTTVIYELRKTDQDRNIRYWTYHEDADHYAIVLVSLNVLENLGFD